MTPETIHLALWIFGCCTAAVVAAVVWLTALVFRVGHKYGLVERDLERLERGVADLEKATEKLERIPAIEAKLDQAIASHAEERRRYASEWPKLQEKVTTLWEKTFSIERWKRASQGQFGE